MTIYSPRHKCYFRKLEREVIKHIMYPQIQKNVCRSFPWQYLTITKAKISWYFTVLHKYEIFVRILNVMSITWSSKEVPERPMLKELDKKLSGKFLIWLFSAELIYCDYSMKIQNKFLILEISLCTFFWHKLNSIWFGSCDMNDFQQVLSSIFHPKISLYLDMDLSFWI